MTVEFVTMGEIVNAVGLRGEVKLLPNGNFDERILRSGFLRRRRAEGVDRLVRCERSRPKGNVMVVKLEGVDDRDEAERTIGSELGFRAADYDEPGFPRDPRRQPAFLYLDLEVVSTRGERIGRVDDVWTLPANWVLRVLVDEGGPAEREVLVPVIDDVVREVDRDAGRVVIEVIPGLFGDGDGRDG